MRRILATVALSVGSLVLAPAVPAFAAVGGAEVGVALADGDGVAVETVRVPAGTSPAAYARELASRPGVLAADLGETYAVADDPLRNVQWALDTLEAERAWTVSEGAGVVVAVLDTGVDASHPDLAGQVRSGADLVDGGDGTEDPNGHGTAVASIVAAAVNGVGMAGLAPQAQILPVRVLGADGSGSSTTVAEGVDWAVDHGADIVNLSLGGSVNDTVLQAAVEQATDAGVLVVAAAGNDGTDGVASYPAALPDVLAVAATNNQGNRASFSNAGSWVDIAAPGVGVAIARPVAIQGDDWGTGNGTSFAAPYVAAAAALVQAQDATLGGAGTFARLVDTATDLAAAGADPATGAGLVNAVAALDVPAEPEPQPEPQPAPTDHEDGTCTTDCPVEDTRPGASGRLATADDPVQTAVEISQAAFPEDGSAQAVVLGRDDVFADSLAGTALAGSSGPVLYTEGGADGSLRAETRAEIARVLPAGGTVNILGGTAAVSTATEDALRGLGYQVRRFSGSTRVETAAAIAMAVDSTPHRVLLARSDSWADAVTGGAWAAEAGLPILVTPSDALHPAAAAALQALGNPEVVLLGGEAALSSRVATEAQAHLRISGSSRAGTATEIARRLWGRTAAAAADHVLVVEGWQANSWAPALAGAVLSARWDAPQVLLDGTTDAIPAETASYLSELGYDSGLRAVATLAGPELGQAHLEAMRGLLGG